MAKEIKYGVEARKALEAGVNQFLLYYRSWHCSGLLLLYL